jgi:putative DNA primase/helicase
VTEDTTAAVEESFREDGGLIVPPPSDPLAVARQFVDEHHRRELDATFASHRDLFYRWADTHWVEMEARDVRSALYGWLEDAQYWKKTKDGPELAKFEPTKFKVADIVAALTAAEHVRSDLDAPSWRGEKPPWADDTAIAMRNGVLARSSRTLHPHSPLFFNTHALGFAYDPNAPSPKRWHSFLRQLWDTGDKTPNTLQEMCGYILCGGTELQKMFLFVGPMRSGKGTIARVLTGLLGSENVCAPTLSSLSMNFGLQPLVDKPLAAIADARLGTRTDALVAVERLLSISGEDAITIDRKYRDPWTGRLPTRFLLLTNEIPAFTDASGALASRFIIHTFSRSFYGDENPKLTDELLEEAPGIFNWCLEGFDRLQERGHFEQPASSTAAMQHLRDLASPVGAFVRDECTIDPDASILKDDLWSAWKVWAEDAGVRKGTKDLLIRDLRAALPQIRATRPRVGERRVNMLSGLRLGPTVDRTPDRADQTNGADGTVTDPVSPDLAQPSGGSGVSGVEPTVGVLGAELDDIPFDLESTNGHIPNGDEDEARWLALYEQASDELDPEDIPL